MIGLLERPSSILVSSKIWTDLPRRIQVLISKALSDLASKSERLNAIREREPSEG